MLRKMSQFCPFPHSPIPDLKSFRFPENVPSQAMKPKKESVPAKSLVLSPIPNAYSRSSTKSTGPSLANNSCPTCRTGLINFALLMGLMTFLKIMLGFCANVNPDVQTIATVIPTNFQYPFSFLSSLLSPSYSLIALSCSSPRTRSDGTTPSSVTWPPSPWSL